MTDSPAIAVVILAAGHGTRMKSSKPKVLHEVGGLSMLGHVLNTANELSPSQQTVVIGEHAPGVGEHAQSLLPSINIAVQAPPRGTGDAVIQALPHLEHFNGVVLILYADTPLVNVKTMQSLINLIRTQTSVAVLGFRPDVPGAYGRLKTNPAGSLEAIVEVKDASAEELKIDLCNSGVMAIESGFLKRALPLIEPNNEKNEYYLTDLVALARKENLTCSALNTKEEEVMGVNSRLELSVAEKIFQNRRRTQAMIDGVTLIDPDSVFFSHDTIVKNDVTIEPNVFIGPKVAIESGATIKANSHLEGAVVGENASVGPFARLRPGANLAADAKVGNFVEIKKSTLGRGAKVSHLTYIGDAEIGNRANIGAGTITCNYDGFNKHITKIGDEAFVGSNSSLVAPVTIGDRAYVGSGSVVTKDVTSGSLAVARGRQSAIEGWADRFRNAHTATKK